MTDKDEYVPTNQRWNASSLAAWEAKVDAEIAEYLKAPCPYYGPDLEFSVNIAVPPPRE